VELLLYSPKRPVVDYSVAFLWLMAVGTIIVASYWSKITVVEQNDEPYKELAEKVLTSKPQLIVLKLLAFHLNTFLIDMS
jgi:signal peptide peptidase-like protein 2B